jgi:hypothetical protein
LTWVVHSGNVQQGDYPCPGYPLSQFHTTGINDLKGCAMGIAYKSNVNDVQPEVCYVYAVHNQDLVSMHVFQDFAIFSVNQTCVWNRFTDFQIPAEMPACPEVFSFDHVICFVDEHPFYRAAAFADGFGSIHPTVVVLRVSSPS